MIEDRQTHQKRRGNPMTTVEGIFIAMTTVEGIFDAATTVEIFDTTATADGISLTMTTQREQQQELMIMGKETLAQRN